MCTGLVAVGTGHGCMVQGVAWGRGGVPGLGGVVVPGICSTHLEGNPLFPGSSGGLVQDRSDAQGHYRLCILTHSASPGGTQSGALHCGSDGVPYGCGLRVKALV